MDYYDNAKDVHESAEILCSNGKYRMSVYNACLAVELYLKSKLSLVEHSVNLEASHDIVNIFRCLTKRFPSSKNLKSSISYCRKYLNESRYPAMGTEAYTEEFANTFLEYVQDVKKYIDEECCANIEDLKNKFGNS